MGYSISVAAKTKEDQERMCNFLEKHYKPIRPDNPTAGFRMDVSYAPDDVDYPIGFDYGCIPTDERVHVYEVVYWMSQVLTDEPHVYYYDDVKTSIKATGDPASVLIHLESLIHIFDGVQKKKTCEFIVKDIARLDAAWKEFNSG